MATQASWSKQSPFQSFLVAGLIIFFVAHFLLLNPSSLEDDFGGIRVIQPKDLLNFLKNEPETLVKGNSVPLDVTPSYSLRDSISYTSEGIQPKMRVVARKSNLYQKEQIAHLRDVQSELQDKTHIDAKEAVYFLEKNEVHFYGDVLTTFPNGTRVLSQFATLFTKPVTHVLIPTSELVQGHNDGKKSKVSFTSQGLDYLDSEDKRLHLLADVHVKIEDEKVTKITSDQAIYNDLAGHLHFYMNENQPLNQQFAEAHQIDLDIKARVLDANLDSKRELKTLTALHDVWIRDRKSEDQISIGTGGRGVYFNKRNDIELTDFPQVTQEGDTIVGDTIIFHRTSDTIEVKQSNAIYSTDKKSNRSETAPRR